MRLEWIEVPTAVRDAVAATLGSPVVSAENQPGGFSPGVAARCQLADGRRVFIKCVSDGQNPMSPSLHRREAKVATALPSGIPTPAFLGTIDDGSWVTLIFEEVDGQPPAQPWSMPDLDATFRALDELTAATTPCPVEGLLPFGTQFAAVFDGFRCLAGGGGAGDRLDDWTRRHLDRLADMEAGWAAGASGQSLVHADVRADNLLVRPDGTIVVVDWPHACVG